MTVDLSRPAPEAHPSAAVSGLTPPGADGLAPPAPARRLGNKLDSIQDRLRRFIAAVSLAGDVRSLRAFNRALRGRGEVLSEPVTMRVRPLGRAPVQLRPGTSDAQMLLEAFRDHVHEPPREVKARGIRHIVDLGANIGVTVAHNARLFPESRIVAVELDPGNAALCRRHVAHLGDRVTVLQGAVWTEDGEVPYVHELGNEYGFYVSDEQNGTHTAPAFSIETILSHLPSDARVDWMKMDVEGVEAKILSGAAAAWAERVDAIGLQVHDPYSLEDCAHDLEQLGFVARIDKRRQNFIRGVRP
jgi:FkbM family methyltransferase